MKEITGTVLNVQNYPFTQNNQVFFNPELSEELKNKKKSKNQNKYNFSQMITDETI